MTDTHDTGRRQEEAGGSEHSAHGDTAGGGHFQDGENAGSKHLQSGDSDGNGENENRKGLFLNTLRPFLSLIIIIAGAAIITSSIIRFAIGKRNPARGSSPVENSISREGEGGGKNYFASGWSFLSDAEAADFLPVYDEFHKRHSSLIQERDSLMALLCMDEVKLPDEELIAYAERLTSLRSEEAALMSAFFMKAGRMLDPGKLIGVYRMVYTGQEEKPADSSMQ